MTTLFFGDMLPPSPEAEKRREHVLVGTATPLKLDVRPIEHDLTPRGSICIGTFHEDKPIGRCAIPRDSVQHFLEMDLFDRPVALALNVRKGGPGMEGSLLALVPMDRASRGGSERDEPWRASVPGAAYDDAIKSGGDDSGSTQLVGIFLGEVVRFEGDRREPASMLREAADMLACVIRGQVDSVGGRVLEDLTASPEG
ncbi:MAG: hypothetical protein F4164_09635 [Gemmatimonadales bacterium]|nr:hypothetical protein [Gemmatimonadales bacterium]MYG49609.1 hypothetical protein [Gemmatimonadales bacterium]MYK01483.1 hypothetical protein [Candidatus Palauibacter ramosifaciens]